MKQFAEIMQKLLAYLWVAFVVFFFLGGGGGGKKQQNNATSVQKLYFGFQHTL